MTTPLQGLYSIYHETMRMLWPRWRRQVDRIDLAQQLRDLELDVRDVGPLPFEEAMALVDGPETPRITLHASNALSVCHWALDNPNDAQRYDPTPELLENRKLISRFLTKHNVETDSLRSVDTLSEAYLWPVRSRRCELSNFWVQVNVGDGTGETTCGAGVEVRRPLRELADRIDPEGWDELIPEFFQKTFLSNASPSDPDDEPPEVVPAPYLFEIASWPLPPNLRVTARNMLEVRYDPSATKLQLQYRLRECLTGEIGTSLPLLSAANSTLLRSYGGIDRDSGFVDVRELGSPGFVSFSGLKSIRFTRHLSFLNAFTPGYLLLFMTLQILGGACYSGHPELSGERQEE